MVAMRGCPQKGCDRWCRWDRLMCGECSGETTRRSYRERTANLCANLGTAAIEEMRVRYTTARVARGGRE
jgi:hypothetical protein